MNTLQQAYQYGALAALSKYGATRYETEIAAGNINRGQVAPGVPELPTPLGRVVSRKMTRDALSAPAQADPSALARKRELAGALFSQQAQRGQVGGGREVPVTVMEGAPPMTKMRYPAEGAAAHVFVPPEPSRYMRSMMQPGLLRGAKNFVGGVRAGMRGELYAPPLGAKMSHDPTIDHSILQHELGEAGEAFKRPGAGQTGPTVQPFASHAGPEPILRENIALRGDPSAVSEIARLRQRHPDDARMQAMIRQAGGTPDAPLPLHGRQHQALERMLGRRAAPAMPMSTRTMGLQHAAAGAHVPFVPADATAGLRGAMEAGANTVTALQGGDWRKAFGHAKGVARGGARAMRFQMTGR